MEDLEKRLNEAKDKLNFSVYDTLYKNSAYEMYIRSLKTKLPYKNVTKSWLKGWEILTLLPSGITNVVFNNDTPNGFHNAFLVWYRRQKQPLNWLLSTYYPPNVATHNKDLYNLKQKYPQNVIVGNIMIESQHYWNDGDMNNPKMPYIISTLVANELDTVDLFISDGWVSEKGKENQQEKTSLMMKYAECLTGLLTLSEGGTFVLKIFTFFTPFMQSLLVYIAHCFHTWDIVKLDFSNPLNSELYFIASGYNKSLFDQVFFEQNKNKSVYDYWYTHPDIHETLLKKLMYHMENQLENIISFVSVQQPSPLTVSN